ncbi:hypothetical protein D3C71_1356690 [compost metagenome]
MFWKSSGDCTQGFCRELINAFTATPEKNCESSFAISNCCADSNRGYSMLMSCPGAPRHCSSNRSVNTRKGPIGKPFIISIDCCLAAIFKDVRTCSQAPEVLTSRY